MIFMSKDGVDLAACQGESTELQALFLKFFMLFSRPQSWSVGTRTSTKAGRFLRLCVMRISWSCQSTAKTDLMDSKEQDSRLSMTFSPCRDYMNHWTYSKNLPRELTYCLRYQLRAIEMAQTREAQQHYIWAFRREQQKLRRRIPDGWTVILSPFNCTSWSSSILCASLANCQGDSSSCCRRCSFLSKRAKKTVCVCRRGRRTPSRALRCSPKEASAQAKNASGRKACRRVFLQQESISNFCRPSPALIVTSKMLRLLLVTPLKKLTALLTATAPEYSLTPPTLHPFLSSCLTIQFTTLTNSSSLTPFLCISRTEDTMAVLITTIPFVSLWTISRPAASPNLRRNKGPSRSDQEILLEKSSMNFLAIIGLQICTKTLPQLNLIMRDALRTRVRDSATRSSPKSSAGNVSPSRTFSQLTVIGTKQASEVLLKRTVSITALRSSG